MPQNLNRAISRPVAFLIIIAAAVLLFGGALGYKLLNPPEVEEMDIFVNKQDLNV